MSVYGFASGESNYKQKQRQQREELLRKSDEVTTKSGVVECKKGKNGKYYCMICPNNPQLDTLEMFFVHKGGRLHKHSQHIQKLKQKTEPSSHSNLTHLRNYVNRNVNMNNNNNQHHLRGDVNNKMNNNVINNNNNNNNNVNYNQTVDYYNSYSQSNYHYFAPQSVLGNMNYYLPSKYDNNNNDNNNDDNDDGDKFKVCHNFEEFEEEMRKYNDIKEKYLNRGWKLENNQLVKDPNIEYDSDEDEELPTKLLIPILRPHSF